MTARPLKSETGLVDQLLLRGRDGIDHGWQQDAACAGHHSPDLWFTRETEQYAREVCVLECPVRMQCFAYAMETAEPWGVWGGYTPEQRQRVARRRALGLEDGAVA